MTKCMDCGKNIEFDYGFDSKRRLTSGTFCLPCFNKRLVLKYPVRADKALDDPQELDDLLEATTRVF